jgi:hypothetical protein
MADYFTDQQKKKRKKANPTAIPATYHHLPIFYYQSISTHIFYERWQVSIMKDSSSYLSNPGRLRFIKTTHAFYFNT